MGSVATSCACRDPGLVHPLLGEIHKHIDDRITKGFDDNDLNYYVKAADENVHIEGSVGLNTTFMFYEKKDEEKVWKSRCYIDSTWVPLTPGSLALDEWRLTRYLVHVMETGDTFGESGGDACQDLC